MIIIIDENIEMEMLERILRNYKPSKYWIERHEIPYWQRQPSTGDPISFEPIVTC